MKKILTLTAVIVIVCSNLFVFSAVGKTVSIQETENKIREHQISYSDKYGIQWEMNYGSDSWYGARYEGPQAIGDCDNDDENELLVAGRDSRIQVFEWDENQQTYLETHTIHPPFYPKQTSDAGGFAIGDLTGDGKNEIAATWNAAVYKWNGKKYSLIGMNSYVFNNGGGNGDCFIGDCDNDGQNELIMSGGPIRDGGTAEEIVVFGFHGGLLVKEAVWNNPDFRYTYVYMAGCGDVDDDGENEIVCGSGLKVWVLDWNKQTKSFDSTVIKECNPDAWQYPFACVCKDSDMDGKNEINVGYSTPEISVFKWDGNKYVEVFNKYWEGEESLIEALDVGDVDDDGVNEICAGTNLVHILGWDGTTYVEEDVLPTWGGLAVMNIGDCDNDGHNEIHCGSVWIDQGEDYMAWVYKYGWETNNEPSEEGKGRLKVTIQNKLDASLGGGSVAAWNLKTKTWYDIQPITNEWGSYYRYNLPAGEYLLRAHVEGYKTQETNIVIEKGKETIYTFSLQPTPRGRVANNILFNLIEKILSHYYTKK